MSIKSGYKVICAKRGHSLDPDHLLKKLNFRTNKLSEDGCWLWTGHLDAGGYGITTVNRRPYRAHRLSYELHVGPIPIGMEMCHTCDVRNCISPKHLWPGTRLENAGDCKAKGRYRFLCGMESPLAKLTDSQAIEIVAKSKSGKSDRCLARAYGVSHSTIQRIRYGKTHYRLNQPNI